MGAPHTHTHTHLVVCRPPPRRPLSREKWWKARCCRGTARVPASGRALTRVRPVDEKRAPACGRRARLAWAPQAPLPCRRTGRPRWLAGWLGPGAASVATLGRVTRNRTLCGGVGGRARRWQLERICNGAANASRARLPPAGSWTPSGSGSASASQLSLGRSKLPWGRAGGSGRDLAARSPRKGARESPPQSRPRRRPGKVRGGSLI